jgi:hypothetical protein
LYFAVSSTSLDPDVLVKELLGDRGRAQYPAVRDAILRLPESTWERDVLEALAHPLPQRIALVNEQLAELDFMIGRWSRVPRVCASIASTTGLLLGAVALRIGLGGAQLADDVEITKVLNGVVADALGVVAIGVAGTVACVAIQHQARKVAKSRHAAADKLIERLESLSLSE